MNTCKFQESLLQFIAYSFANCLKATVLDLAALVSSMFVRKIAYSSARCALHATQFLFTFP